MKIDHDTTIREIQEAFIGKEIFFLDKSESYIHPRIVVPIKVILDTHNGNINSFNITVVAIDSRTYKYLNDTIRHGRYISQQIDPDTIIKFSGNLFDFIETKEEMLTIIKDYYESMEERSLKITDRI